MRGFYDASVSVLMSKEIHYADMKRGLILRYLDLYDSNEGSSQE